MMRKGLSSGEYIFGLICLKKLKRLFSIEDSKATTPYRGIPKEHITDVKNIKTKHGVNITRYIGPSKAMS